MNHPINIDHILEVLLKELRIETEEWLRGNPRSEEDFLNRITEVLAKNRKCDVGIEESYSINLKHYQLHRKGKNKTDRFGSDLAVTVWIPDKEFKKTCLFQIKKSEHYKVTVEKHQIDEASVFMPIRERSFVLTVDDPRGGIKIHSLKEVAEQFREEKYKSFDCGEWDALSTWMIKWLNCEVGAGNRPNVDPIPIEPLLESQLREQRQMTFDSFLYELPPDYNITKDWFEYKFIRKAQ